MMRATLTTSDSSPTPAQQQTPTHTPRSNKRKRIDLEIENLEMKIKRLSEENDDLRRDIKIRKLEKKQWTSLLDASNQDVPRMRRLNRVNEELPGTLLVGAIIVFLPFCAKALY